jgi:streptogramin lyase
VSDGFSDMVVAGDGSVWFSRVSVDPASTQSPFYYGLGRIASPLAGGSVQLHQFSPPALDTPRLEPGPGNSVLAGVARSVSGTGLDDLIWSIALVTPTGLSEYPIPISEKTGGGDVNAHAEQFAVGADGAIWYAVDTPDIAFVRIDPQTGEQTVHPPVTPASIASALTLGPGGSLYYSTISGCDGAIGVIDTDTSAAGRLGADKAAGGAARYTTSAKAAVKHGLAGAARCTKKCVARFDLKLRRAGRDRTLDKARVRLKQPDVQTKRLKIPSGARKALLRRGKTRVVVTTRIREGGKAQVDRRVVTLRGRRSQG